MHELEDEQENLGSHFPLWDSMIPSATLSGSRQWEDLKRHKILSLASTEYIEFSWKNITDT